MTDTPHAVPLPAHAPHALVSWPAVIAGAAVAIAVGAMLNLLGVALGAAALDPFDIANGDEDGFSALAGLWIAISNLVGLAVGGFVASRSAKYPDHHRGLLLGLAVWAVAFLVAIAVVSASTTVGVSSVMHGVLQRPDAVDLAGAPAEYYLPPPATAASEDAAVGPVPIPPVSPAVGRGAEAAADSAATMALWAFLTMLLSAVGAVLGARYGLTRHRWEDALDDSRRVLRRDHPVRDHQGMHPTV